MATRRHGNNAPGFIQAPIIGPIGLCLLGDEACHTLFSHSDGPGTLPQPAR